ncbi:ComEA family DNA-binding protein [Blautia sp. MSJ-19]|uniref:ComEA family DNA-binding protein n=1 Tax=Blautia sp. MSJ-19 TaxID=2841517 RepID=UPI001C0F3B0E|nr:ComEA family DNA-binding protein [Blautia sp. MSJ-19]MBU5481018.1 ComEA family DNA-binding protein [Blautia sp. MSJ-19]
MKAKLYSLMLGVTLLFTGMGMGGCQKQKTEIMLDEQVHEESSDLQAESRDEKTENQTETTISEIPAEELVEVFVDVCGAVHVPGVYALKTDSRVFQAIEAAGGFLPEAAASAVNQAQPVADGQQIYVPTQEEVKEGTLPAQIQSAKSENGSEVTAEGVININTADAAALKSLTGIGDAKAQAILAYREEHGRFSSIEEIMQVPGIKESTFSAIKDKIAVE